MMRVSSNSRLIATSHPDPGCGMCAGDALPADDDVLLAVGFKRTLHTPVPGKRHTHSYPHHHHYYRRGVLRVSKFLSFLLFLVICDSQTVSRAAFRTSAATIGHLPGADADTDSIISGSDDGAAATSGAAINRTKLQEIVLEGLGLSALPDVRMKLKETDHDRVIFRSTSYENRYHLELTTFLKMSNVGCIFFEIRLIISIAVINATTNVPIITVHQPPTGGRAVHEMSSRHSTLKRTALAMCESVPKHPGMMGTT
uniref:Uncharacterized protein n=1 Tax=Anopheles culicifacies TaxID=139723 RepID=A0A182M4V0_9DIPT